MNKQKCDCLTWCGDDEDIRKGKAQPCDSYLNRDKQPRDRLQKEILTWACNTFGHATANNTDERTRRFAEEAIELAQAAGLSKEVMMNLVDYVYARPAGDINREIGQVGVSLLAYAEHMAISANAEEQAEFNRLVAIDPAHFQARQNAKAAAGIGLASSAKVFASKN